MNADFLAHLQTGVTTLCRAWGVTRRDRVWLGFTDHDMDISLDGMQFQASSGLAAKALQQTTGLSVDNSEAMGALSAIDEADLIAGRFDGAEVRVWLLNWADPAQNMEQFRGHFGDVTRAGGAFKVELRGLTDLLNQTIGRSYHRGCSAVLGDAACKAVVATVPMVVADIMDGTYVLNGNMSQTDGWYDLGRFGVTTGISAGLLGMVKRDRARAGGRLIDLWQDIPLAIGDQITLQAGCDRQASTCQAKFNNLLNFQGFPHIPGEDWQISYPNPLQPKDGGSLFK
jgi:uncharacterized phage protein (TIGR02218 family)